MCTRLGGLTFTLAFCLSLLWLGAGQAKAGQYCERTNYSAQDITDAVRNSPLRDDLLKEVRRLAKEARFDYLLIEGTGIAEPRPIAATFSFRDENGVSLSDFVKLDTMVTVADASSLLANYGSSDLLRDRGETRDRDDQRTLVDLLVEQIEFADVVVINKVSDATEAMRAEVRRVVVALNPDARQIEADFGKIPLEAILNTGLFDEAKAATHPLWHKELYNPGAHLPETEEFGVSSFVYRARRPFDPARFHAFLAMERPGLLRAKGHFWLASRPDWIGLLSIAGTQVRAEPKGMWWASVPRAHWPRHAQFQEMLQRHWTPVWGDRRQEIVFIGSGMSEDAIRQSLDDCLVGADTGYDPRLARGLFDPFPVWGHDHVA